MSAGIKPKLSLPLPIGVCDEVSFRDDLLKFACNCERWQVLCGGVHMLDFLVREPDLYETVLPLDWRAWLKEVDILDLLDLLNRENISSLQIQKQDGTPGQSVDEADESRWRSYERPPDSLLSYISTVRSYLFDRSFDNSMNYPRKSGVKPLNKQLATGMNSKKLHEVEQFSAFVSDLCNEVSYTTGHRISDVVDFGAGQGYLGRSLASPLYKIDVVSVESKPHNITGAKKNDVLAKVSKQEVVFRNKKLFRAGIDQSELQRLEKMQLENVGIVSAEVRLDEKDSRLASCGVIRHIEHRITGGNLHPVIEKLKYAKETTLTSVSENLPAGTVQDTKLMVISLHSCGNLLHHGLRSLAMNDSVKAVAMIGCCYNLCTERLGGPTFKLPNLRLRAQNKRLLETSNACDADGFPMSDHFVNYVHKGETGIRLNITARMMAVQAPRNWTQSDCDGFFTRHWYRALLQRILLERGIVQPVICGETADDALSEDMGGASQPITIGKLSKHCFNSFVSYVRGALLRLSSEETRGGLFSELNQKLSDADIEDFETRFGHRRHELCILWSFMAFSAGVVETLIVTDRWQWLREQEQVEHAWVQPVFDYSQSPRNLVIVGIKK